MKKILTFLVLTTLLFSAFSAHAAALLTAEKGYGVSLTSEASSGSSSLNLDRTQKLYLIGPVINNSGKTQSVRFGVELKEVATGELYYKVLDERKEWVDGLQLSSVSFNLNFIIRNGAYEVRAVCMDLNKDASVSFNWEAVSVPAGFTVPTLNVTGDQPAAYFPTQPYVGNPRNKAELSDTNLHVTLKALADIADGELIVFVFEPDSELSIGYYKLSFTLKAGESKEYSVEYKKSGSQAADLEVGKTYELSFRLFDNRKEVYFDWRYDFMSFTVVEIGMDILLPLEENDDRMIPTRKLMLEDGSLIIEQGNRKYGISGSVIK